MSLIVQKCMTNWLKTAIDATKDPMKVGRMLTLQEFVKYTEFSIDEYSMNKFYYNLDNDIPVYMDNSIIEWFGYKGDIIKQKQQIKEKLIMYNAILSLGQPFSLHLFIRFHYTLSTLESMF